MAKYHSRYRKPKKPFLQRWLPWKGDSAKMVILKLFTLVLLAVFLGCAGYLVNELVILPAHADQTVDELKEIYYHVSSENETGSSGNDDSQQNDSDDAEEEPEMTDEQIRQQIQQLQKINPDIIGWIKIHNTVIDYPVLQSSESDPEYYLYRDYKGEYTKYGSIFLQAGTALDGSDQNTMLYGHSMKDGRMFAQLLTFSDLDVYKKSPVITFNTAEGGGKWKIISVFKANTYKNQGEPFIYNISSFGSDSDYLDFAYQVYQRSIINTGVDFNENDTMLMLSTCSYEFDGFRTVVAARQVREGEDPAVDTGKASYNAQVVYPECWYDRYGGSMPSWPDTFEEALAQDKIDWYTQP